jgi:hypothetical protein
VAILISGEIFRKIFGRILGELLVGNSREGIRAKDLEKFLED